MEISIIFIIYAAIVSLIYYQMQKRIGEDQAVDWQDFVKANPQYFKKPDAPLTKDAKCHWPDDQKKFIEGVWDRYYAQRQSYAESENIRKESDSRRNNAVNHSDKPKVLCKRRCRSTGSVVLWGKASVVDGQSV